MSRASGSITLVAVADLLALSDVRFLGFRRLWLQVRAIKLTVMFART